MKTKITSTDFKMILIAGSVWGMSEVLMGAWLNGCAFKYTGAIMTGLAFFYMSFTLTATRKMISLLLLLTIAILFKMLDAVLLSVPVTHGSVMNPSFAFILEVMGFCILAAVVGQRFFQKTGSRLITGAGAAIFAVLLFPVAGFFTGSAACVVAGTQIPVSIYTSPLAIALSMFTVSAGFFAATRLQTLQENGKSKIPALKMYWPEVVFAVCVAAVAIHGAI